MLFFKPNVDRLRQKNDVAGLIRALSWPKDGWVRMHTAEALGDLRAAEAVQPLIAALSDGVAREAAFIALVKTRDPRAVESLLQNLPNVANRLVLRLLEWAGERVAADTRVVRALVAILNDTGQAEANRLDAVQWLERAGGDAALDALADQVRRRNPPPAIATAISEALVRSGRDAAGRTPAECARDEAEAREAEARSLAERYYRAGKLDKCAAVGEAAISVLAEPLNRQTRQIQMGMSFTRTAYGPVDLALLPNIEALGKIGGDSRNGSIKAVIVDRLLPACYDDKPEVVLAAARALARIGGADAALALRNLAGHLDPAVRAEAKAALERFGPAAVVEGLAMAGETGSRAAKALEDSPDPRAVAPLVALLKNGYVDARRAAAMTLRKWYRANAIAEPERAAIDAVMGTVREIIEDMEDNVLY